MSKPKEILLEQPTSPYFKPSFNSTAMESNKTPSYPSTIDNFDILAAFEEKRSNSKIKKLFYFQRKRHTVVPKPENSMKPGSKRNSWCLMRNFMKGVHLMKSPDVKSIRSIKEFEENINDETQSPIFHIKQIDRNHNDNNFPKNPALENTKKAFEGIRRRERFFSLLQVGGEDVLLDLQKCFDHDPKRYIFDARDMESLANKKNEKGETPLYLACKNGNLQVVRFLLGHNANPHVYFEKDNVKMDSILSVAARWNFIELLDFLLKNIHWKREELAFALKNLSKKKNEATKRMLEGVLMRKSNVRIFFKRILCCLRGI